MCQFFSCISDGEGKVLFFKIENIVKEMVKGNPNEYNWNSHTSIADYHGIKGAEEDKWNKWEYDTTNQILKVDQLNTIDDRIQVKKKVKNYFKNKDILYLQNIYNMNSGGRNSGDMNSGDMNSGNRNSGDMNSGNRNSGNWNSGNMNSGNWNSGNMNSGDMNSGNRNSGNWNSGNWNSGDRNSGNMNSNNPDKYRVFNKWILKEKYDNIQWPDFFWFDLTQWISHDTATAEEKEKYKKEIEVTGGFLKTLNYKEAWQLSYKRADQNDKDKVKKIPGFNPKIFEEITGIKI